jgi:hypothetical protein
MSAYTKSVIAASVLTCSACVLLGLGIGFSWGVSKGAEWVGKGFDKGYKQAFETWSRDAGISPPNVRPKGSWPTLDLGEFCASYNADIKLPSSQYVELKNAGIDPEQLCKSAAQPPK